MSKNKTDLADEELLRDHIISTITSLGLKSKNSDTRITICCPFHDDKTPSLDVHLADNFTGCFIGHFHCWGCGTRGSWPELAKKLGVGLEGLDFKAQKADNPFGLLLTSLKRMATSKTTTSLAPPTSTARLEEIPDNFSWRGIPSSFYRAMKAKIVWDNRKGRTYLYFPLEMNGIYQGYTLCDLGKEKKISQKYLLFHIGTPLFLFDWVPHRSTIVLVEGHFDALRLRYYGVNACAIFGSQKWEQKRQDLILSKNPKKILILMDNDEAGKAAALSIYEKLAETKLATICNLPESGGKVDPGNMPLEYIHFLLEL